MKKNYVKPQILVHNTRIKNYIICNSGGTQEPPGGGDHDEDVLSVQEVTWGFQRSKDRGTSVWENDEGIW